MGVYGLIGGRLSHSYSKTVHEALWIDNYNMWEIAPGSLDPFMRYAEWDGVNVTIPYKQAVIPYCDMLDPSALRVGCVNTVIKRDGRFFGYNTDYFGFKYLACSLGITFRDKKVLVLGDGATSLTACAVIKDDHPFSLTVLSRKTAPYYSDIRVYYDSEIIVNTTPVGMFPDNGDTLIDISSFPRLVGVIDVIYNPSRSRLVTDAQKHGIKAGGGLPMLVAQAVRSAQLFSGRVFDDQSIDRVIRQTRAESENIVLIGMPGSGKSTVGHSLALSVGRDFYDVDSFVHACADMSARDMIEKYSEQYFRDKETEALEELTKKSGIVISTGGGSILREYNRELIRQNSRVYYIKRPVTELTTRGRPLSADPDSLIALYKIRRPLYLQTADVVVPEGTIAQRAEYIIKDFFG